MHFRKLSPLPPTLKRKCQCIITTIKQIINPETKKMLQFNGIDSVSIDINYVLFTQFTFPGICNRLNIENSLFKTIFMPEMSTILCWTNEECMNIRI